LSELICRLRRGIAVTQKPVIDLSGKVALVCGAGAGGIGSATSLLLAQAGAEIVAVDRTAQLLEETRAAVVAMGGKCTGIVADLRSTDEVEAILPALRSKVGGVDLVANVAGGTQKGEWIALEKTPNEVYKSVMALNLDYVFRVCRDAAALMIEQGRGGAIVNISSVSATAAAPFHGPYGAAKCALLALTQTMAVEWGPHGIRANVVVPGAVATPRAGAGADRYRDIAPLGRPAYPGDIAAAIAFLLSDLASAITGQSLIVDTGICSISRFGSLDGIRKSVR
jgi:NAD(P)-dependent dehydrogenase (short-subunit alcohol dehydrogenase family)